MTSTPLSPAQPAVPRLSRLLVQGAVLSLLPMAIVVVALGPAKVAKVVATVSAVHPHLPYVGLIAQEPLAVQLHLTAVLIALIIGIALLIGVKGRTMHRTMGWSWVVAMMIGAVSSLFIRMVNHGSFSFIHLLSGWTIVALPMGVALARRHKVRMHARMMTGLFTGGLILAGLFAFFPGRLMWQMVFG